MQFIIVMNFIFIAFEFLGGSAEFTVLPEKWQRSVYDALKLYVIAQKIKIHNFMMIVIVTSIRLDNTIA